jgi:hypothetical protein
MAAAAEAAAALAAAVDAVGGGERLPGAGKWPPTGPVSAGRCPAALRVGLGPALLRAAAKSWALAPDFTELAAAAEPCCAGSDASGVCDTEGVAFIQSEQQATCQTDMPRSAYPF